MKRWWLLVVAGVILLAGAAGLYLSLSHKSSSQPAAKQSAESSLSFHDNTTSASVKYPQSLSSVQLNEQDKADKLLLRLQQSSGSPLLVTVRYETGVRKAAAVAHIGTRDLLLDSTKRALPGRYPGYKQLSQRKFDLNGQQAAEVIFTYESPAHEAVEQRFVIVLKDEDTAVYVAAQSQSSTYDSLNSRYFSPVIDSVNFN